MSVQAPPPPAPAITQPGTFLPLVRLALPVLAGHLLDMMVGITDTFLTGNYLATDEHLAAMNLVSYLAWFIVSLFALVSIGTTAMVARFVGAGDWATARHVTNQALLAGLFVCAAPVILVIVFGQPLIGALGLEQDAAALTLRYLWILLPAVPAMMIEQVGNAALRGAGDTMTGMMAMVITNLVDMFASYALVRGLGPIPALGWDGLAIGTTLGYFVGTIIIGVRLWRGHAGLRFEPRLFRPNANLMRRLLRISLPGGIDILAMIACHLWFVRIINVLGNVPAGAHGIAIKIESLSFMPGAAFQVAAATLVGQALGAQQPRRAVRVVVVGCWTTSLLMLGTGAMLFFGSEALASFFVRADHGPVAQEAAALVRIVSLAQPALAILMVLVGSLRGAGDTRGPLALTFVGFLLVRIPLAVLLAWSDLHFIGLDAPVQLFDLGVRGAWYAMLIDLYVRTAMAILRFRQGVWKRIEL